ncbi:hypothetical protein LTR95_006403, partial [Oleoguttula sp. CCFEE 5521]
MFSMMKLTDFLLSPIRMDSSSLYVPLNAGGSLESFDHAPEKSEVNHSVEESGATCHCQHRRSHWLMTHKLLWVAVTLTAISILTAVIALTPRRSGMSQVSQPSPLLHDLEIRYHDQVYNGSFLKENAFRGPAGPETDAAWEALGVNYRAAVVAEAQAEVAGMSRDKVRISPEFGGGYPANVE